MCIIRILNVCFTLNQYPMKNCLACEKIIEGRSDKKFCDSHCKSAYHYNRNKLDTTNFYHRVDRQLKLNRSLLKKYNRAGKATIRSKTLIGHGFDPNFFTHFWKNSKGQVYLFVYEFGFLRTSENNHQKFILIQWQDYMERSVR